MENVKSKRSALVSFVLVFALLATLLYGGLLQTKAADWFYVTYDYCGGTSPKGNATERTTNGGQNFSLSDKFGTAPKDGMRIFGWYLDKDYSEEGKLIEYRNEVHNYRDGDPHAETILREKGDTTIYARWGYGYNVTVTNAVIVPEGRVYTENTYYGEKGKPVHIEELVYGPEKESDEGKLFGGYYTKPNGEGTLVTPAVVYREEAYGGYEEFVWPYYVIDLEFQADQDVTLYAYWADGYTMTYDANGGVGGTKKSMQAPFIKVDDTSLEKPTREGYTLIGWSESKDGKNAFQLKDYVVSKDVTLYAVWEKNTTPDPTPTPTSLIPLTRMVTGGSTKTVRSTRPITASTRTSMAGGESKMVRSTSTPRASIRTALAGGRLRTAKSPSRRTASIRTSSAGGSAKIPRSTSTLRASTRTSLAGGRPRTVRSPSRRTASSRTNTAPGKLKTPRSTSTSTAHIRGKP